MDWQNGFGLHKNLNKLSDDDKSNIQYGGCKVFVGKEERDGERLEFYIFWCPDCEAFSYDCPHGSIEERYLVCHLCGGKIDFAPWWARLKREWKSLLAWLRGLDNHAG